jgi:hypothetical protein
MAMLCELELEEALSWQGLAEDLQVVRGIVVAPGLPDSVKDPRDSRDLLQACLEVHECVASVQLQEAALGVWVVVPVAWLSLAQ